MEFNVKVVLSIYLYSSIVPKNKNIYLFLLCIFKNSFFLLPFLSFVIIGNGEIQWRIWLINFLKLKREVNLEKDVSCCLAK